MEIWKDITGYEGLYQVSNLGNVKSLSRKMWNGFGFFNSKDKILKPNLIISGYYSVHFMKDNIKKSFTIHRLVAKAFLKDTKGYEVNHKDRNKINNNLNNLEFISHSDNIKHTYITGRKKPKKFINGRSLFVIDLQTGIFYNLSEFYKHVNVTRKTVNRFVSGSGRYNFS
jgi:hypothetical protein